MKLVAILDETDKKIIELLCEGLAPKEIAHKMWKKKAYIHNRLTALRKHYKCETTIKLVAYLLSKEEVA